MLAGEQSCESRHHRPVRRVQRRSVDLAPQYRHLVAQHDDLDGEIGVTTEDESEQLEDAAERLVEDREGHGRMLAAPESRRQSARRRPWSLGTDRPWSHRCCGRPGRSGTMGTHRWHGPAVLDRSHSTTRAITALPGVPVV
jgi:hypothetical protein